MMAACAASFTTQWEEGKDVPFVPTPPEVVDAMLKLAEIKSSDFVIDLGCGDGRIVVAAASRKGYPQLPCPGGNQPWPHVPSCW